MPRLAWAYVFAVVALATVSAFTDSLAAYLILLVVSAPVCVAVQVANLMLLFGFAALFHLDVDGDYPLLGVLTIAVWTAAGWMNAKLFQLAWQYVHRAPVTCRSRRQTSYHAHPFSANARSCRWRCADLPS